MNHGASSPTSSTLTRVSKACENCRQRRRKCDGRQPCSTCVKYGQSQQCHLRSKARPKRYSQSYPRSTLTFRALAPEEIGHHSQVNPIHFIKQALESWSAGQGKLDPVARRLLTFRTHNQSSSPRRDCSHSPTPPARAHTPWRPVCMGECVFNLHGPMQASRHTLTSRSSRRFRGPIHRLS